MIEVEIPNNVLPRRIPTGLLGTVVRKVLKSVLPENDYNIIVNISGDKRPKLVIMCEKREKI
jgi:hypothetical protein